MVQVKINNDGQPIINLDAGPSADQLIDASYELFKKMKEMARSVMPAGKTPYIYSALEKLAEAIESQSRTTGLLKTVKDYIIAYTRGGLSK